MRLEEVRFNEVQNGYSPEERTKEENMEIAELFRKKLKLARLSYYVDRVGDIHFSSKTKWVDVTQRNRNTYIIAEEDAHNNRKFKYMKLIKD